MDKEREITSRGQLKEGHCDKEDLLRPVDVWGHVVKEKDDIERSKLDGSVSY